MRIYWYEHAVLYNEHKYEFYIANAVKEPEVSKLLSKISSDIEKQMLMYASSKVKKIEYQNKKVLVKSINPFSVTNTSFDNNKLNLHFLYSVNFDIYSNDLLSNHNSIQELEISIEFSKVNKKAYLFSFTKENFLNLEFIDKFNSNFANKNKGQFNIFSNRKWNKLINTDLFNKYLKLSFYDKIKKGYYSPISNDTLYLVQVYLSALDGSPGEINSLNRMLYFSAVTITTTGYGDILPLTDNMRWWIGVEAFCGIILSGAFLWWFTVTPFRPRTREKQLSQLDQIEAKLQHLENLIQKNQIDRKVYTEQARATKKKKK